MLQAYKVSVGNSAGTDDITVIAFTCCDAIIRALDIMFDGEDPLPTEGLSISAKPA